MYRLESFQDGRALIVNDAPDSMYRCAWNADSLGHAIQIAIGLNQPVLLDQLAVYRFEFETAGLDLGEGVRIKTDRESQGQIGDAYTALKNGLIPDTDFKAASGWQVVDLAQITPIAKATAAHSRGCFRGERSVASAIESAATLEQIEAIDIPRLFGAAYAAAYAEVMTPA